MTMLLSVLAVALSSSTSIAGLTREVTTQKKEVLTPVTFKDFQPSREQAEEIEFSKSLTIAINDLQKEFGLTEADVKVVIERSMVMSESQKVSFNLAKLNEFKTSNLYKLISSNEALASSILTKLVAEGLLGFNAETGVFSFQEPTSTTPYNDHIWTVYHWTWFMYWELHFDSELSQTIAFLALAGAAKIDEIIEAIGPIDGCWSVGIKLIGKICEKIADQFSEKDLGSGVCLRWDGPIPRDLVSR